VIAIFKVAMKALEIPLSGNPNNYFVGTLSLRNIKGFSKRA